MIILKDIFVLGFDPIFLDILVSPLDQNKNKLNNFPEIGEHVPNTIVKLIPGGNSLNVARMLTKLTSNVFFFGAFNSFFLELIHSNISNLTCISTTNAEPNFTIAIQFNSGEIQMNSIKAGFGINDLNLESIFYLIYSRIVPFSNIGLNAKGPDLFDQIASLFIELKNQIGDSGEERKNIEQFLVNWLHNSKITEQNSPSIDKLFQNINSLTSIHISKKIFYFDPSSLKSFTHWTWLILFIQEKFTYLPGYKIISINEYEFSLMIKNKINFNFFLSKNDNYLIVHETNIVTIYTKNLENETVVSVPKIDPNLIISSVGAGDSFNAGLLYEFSKSLNIYSAVNHGIYIVQQFLTNTI